MSDARRLINGIRLVLGAVCALLFAAHAAAQPSGASDAVFRAVVALETDGSLYEAKSRLDQRLAERPDDASARAARARVLLRLGRAQDALADARIAANALPADGLVLVTRMEAARLAGLAGEAQAAGDAAADLALTSAPLHVRLAWNARLLGRYRQAEAFARIALLQDPRHAPAYAELARIFRLQGLDDAGASVLVRGLETGALSSAAFEPQAPLADWTDHPEVRRALR
jgi:tetratricopeptide (TPR) repeat protein